jgi:hypothetical protein
MCNKYIINLLCVIVFYAHRGMKNYQRKLSIKEQFKVAGKVIGAVSAVVGIISFLLGLLF